MEKSSFFNSVNGDRKYKASDFAEYFNSFIGNGVFPNPSTNLQVIANNNMTVTLKAGKSWINGYFYINTDDLVLGIDISDGVLNRIDRIVLEFSTINRTIVAKVKKGSFASSPTAPTLQRDADAYELGIADIYVGKGIVSITQANITDLRLNNIYCGVVRGTVDQVDTTTLFNQYQYWYSQKQAEFNSNLTEYTNTKQTEINTWFTNVESDTQTDIDNMEAQFQADWNVWFSNIQAALDGDTAGNLLNQIDVVESNIGNITTLTTTDKTSTVNAINEVNNKVADNSYKIGVLSDDLEATTLDFTTFQESVNTSLADVLNKQIMLNRKLRMGGMV